MTLYGTGMRRSELAHLKVGDIDSQRMIIRVVAAGKGGKDRDLPLSPTLLETGGEYWRWRKPKLYLFPVDPPDRAGYHLILKYCYADAEVPLVEAVLGLAQMLLAFVDERRVG